MRPRLGAARGREVWALAPQNISQPSGCAFICRHLETPQGLLSIHGPLSHSGRLSDCSLGFYALQNGDGGLLQIKPREVWTTPYIEKWMAGPGNSIFGKCIKIEDRVNLCGSDLHMESLTQSRPTDVDLQYQEGAV